MWNSFEFFKECFNRFFRKETLEGYFRILNEFLRDFGPILGGIFRRIFGGIYGGYFGKKMLGGILD